MLPCFRTLGPSVPRGRPGGIGARPDCAAGKPQKARGAQGIQEYFWTPDEVNAQLNESVTRAFDETWDVHERRGVSMRLAAYGLAVRRVADATVTRGLYP